MDDFLQKLKKLVRIVLYGPAISQSDCRKAGPYQLTYNNVQYKKCSDKKFLQTCTDLGRYEQIKLQKGYPICTKRNKKYSS